MATAKKILHEKLRQDKIKLVSDFLTENGEEILITGSNEIALPCVDSEGNDEFMVITFKVPTGSREGDVYDGYAMAQDYEIKQKDKKEKAIKDKIAKEKKIASDKKMREQKALIKEKANKEGK